MSFYQEYPSRESLHFSSARALGPSQMPHYVGQRLIQLAGTCQLASTEGGVVEDPRPSAMKFPLIERTNSGEGRSSSWLPLHGLSSDTVSSDYLYVTPLKIIRDQTCRLVGV